MLIFRRFQKLEFYLTQNRITTISFTTIKLFSSSSNAEQIVTGRKDRNENQSFTISYLVNSCGLTPQSAKSASKWVKFESPDRPDSVLNFLKKQGFTDAHISRLVKRRPILLSIDPDSVLLPKFQFLRSKGASTLDLATIVFCNADLLKRSLDKHIIPCYNALKVMLLDDDKVVKTLRRASWFFMQQMQKNVAPNVQLLRQLGVPRSFVSQLITNSPSVICLKDETFDDNVKKVVEMGFNPAKYSFIDALVTSSQLSDETMRYKMDVYKRWGLSEEAIWSAFKKKPSYLKFSEKKVMCTMDFLVNVMRFSVGDVFPHVLFYSLEKRIVPRCLVIKALQLKGLFKDEYSVSSIIAYNDDYFLSRFVVKYRDEMPQLLDIFHGKTSLSSCSSSSSSSEYGLKS